MEISEDGAAPVTLTGRFRFLSYDAEFSVDGVKLFFGQDLKRSPRFELLEFQLVDMSNKVLYRGSTHWLGPPVYEVRSSSDPLDVFYTRYSYRIAKITIGKDEFEVSIWPTKSQFELLGEIVHMKFRWLKIDVTFPPALVNKLPLEKFVAIMYVIWAERRFTYSGGGD